MEFEREVQSVLVKWKSGKNRKPLVLRGARQVGKTTLVKAFAKTYRHRILLNLERPKDRRFFEQHEDVHTLLEALMLTNGITGTDVGETLLFIDEIQESPKAIQMLRFFYEELPQLHVIAAGSLLEFAMGKVKSFPVGRIQYLYLHPLSFTEFLKAGGHSALIEKLHEVPLRPAAFGALMELFNRYAVVGGMPEVVKVLLGEGLTELPQVYESIWATYKEDVEKYAHGNSERQVIRHLLATAPLYLEHRIKFQNFGNSNYRSREVGEAFRTLEGAKVIRLIYPTTDLETPIKPDLKKSPRLQFLDTGMINHVLGLQAEMLPLRDMGDAHRGAIIPHLVAQELIALHSMESYLPNFWVREKPQASSEVDLVYPYKGLAIPVEIKSGSIGKLKSLLQFVERAPHPYAVRLYAGKFSIEHHRTPMGKTFHLMNLPYFLGAKLPEYVAYLVGEGSV